MAAVNYGCRATYIFPCGFAILMRPVFLLNFRLQFMKHFRT